jgi:glycosyltransferase involved in cell wall biosynthesis
MLYFVSLYYKKSVFTGANKRFDELGRLLVHMLGDRFRIIVCEGEQPAWAPRESCIFVSPYASLLERLRASRQLRAILNAAESGQVVSDFMPIPFSALKQHRHYQLIYDLRNFTEFARGGLSILTARFQRWQLSRSSKIITISEFSRNDIVARCSIPESDVIVSYCGVGPDYLSHSSGQKKDIDVLYVASFEPRKNHLGLLQALALSLSGLKVRLVGRDLGTQDRVRSLARRLEASNEFKFEFIDSMSEEELRQSYQRARLYVFPSFLEGFGMPLIEALATNCRIACSDIDVFRELCGERALYFDPGNAESMWATIEAALSEKDTPNNCEYVQKFLWQNIANDLLQELGIDPGS